MRRPCTCWCLDAQLSYLVSAVDGGGLAVSRGRLVLDDGGVPDRLRNLVLAYFACLHGTGCVERGLGLDKRAVVEPHVGSLRPSAKVEEENSSCLELHREGPRRFKASTTRLPASF